MQNKFAWLTHIDSPIWILVVRGALNEGMVKDKQDMGIDLKTLSHSMRGVIRIIN